MVGARLGGVDCDNRVVDWWWPKKGGWLTYAVFIAWIEETWAVIWGVKAWGVKAWAVESCE
jgi:hypothetical protein